MTPDDLPARLVSAESRQAVPSTRFPRLNVFFYGISAGVITGLLVQLTWRASELHGFERRLRIAGVPSDWFESPKARAAIVDPNLFNVFSTGLGYDVLFWPLAGVTIAWYWIRPSSDRPGPRLIVWAIGVAALGIFSIIRTNSQFRGIMDREVQRKLRVVAEWEERKASHDGLKKAETESSTARKRDTPEDMSRGDTARADGQ